MYYICNDRVKYDKRYKRYIVRPKKYANHKVVGPFETYNEAQKYLREMTEELEKECPKMPEENLEMLRRKKCPDPPAPALKIIYSMKFNDWWCLTKDGWYWLRGDDKWPTHGKPGAVWMKSTLGP